MPRTIGYMLTWTTYGSWLQGDVRGYVTKGQIFPGDKKIINLCGKFQKSDTIRLKRMKEISFVWQY